MSTRDEVYELLERITNGDRGAVSELLPLVYDELRQQAAAAMRGERTDHTLQPTALVHEAYLKLVGQDRVHWRSRDHFLAVAASQMRRVLVDHARARNGPRRGGARRKVVLREDDAVVPVRGLDLVALDEALEKLAAWDERKARVVELRHFGGMTNEQVAEHLGISRSTVDREWDFAHRWLLVQLRKGDG